MYPPILGGLFTMRRVLIIILLLPTFLCAQHVDIGLWRDGKKTTRFYFMSENATTWYGDGKKFSLPANKSIYLTYESGLVRLSTAEKKYGLFKKVKTEENDHFNLVSLKPVRTEEIYHKYLTITPEKGGLKVINSFDDIDDYISGVVEAETGKEQNKEFYKVQATISRTFAMSNSRRHEAEGFNMCDQVHCQVYHGISRHNPLILDATAECAGEVIVDPEIELITASFHSNCGGHTSNSEDVWSKALPYLRSIRDTFCLQGVHAEWDVQIDQKNWLDHISHQYNLRMDTEAQSALTQFESAERIPTILVRDTHVLKKDLRRKWRLKSSHFNCESHGDEILLKGKGHGHGVGLCQEGAMRMSKIGYNYAEILQFYYTDVHLIHRTMVDFFKDN